MQTTFTVAIMSRIIQCVVQTHCSPPSLSSYCSVCLQRDRYRPLKAGHGGVEVQNMFLQLCPSNTARNTAFPIFLQGLGQSTMLIHFICPGSQISHDDGRKKCFILSPPCSSFGSGLASPTSLPPLIGNLGPQSRHSC